MQSLRLNLKTVVQSRAQAAGQLVAPGDAVLIERGTPRWLLLACPCGCGAEIPINLDVRAGKAWRLYKHQGAGLSVYPSVWRDTDCGSHFVIWRQRILLFDGEYQYVESFLGDEPTTTLADAVLQRLRSQVGLVSYVQIADYLGEIPWDILDVCRSLVRRQLLREGRARERGKFGLKQGRRDGF